MVVVRGVHPGTHLGSHGVTAPVSYRWDCYEQFNFMEIGDIVKRRSNFFYKTQDAPAWKLSNSQHIEYLWIEVTKSAFPVPCSCVKLMYIITAIFILFVCILLSFLKTNKDKYIIFGPVCLYTFVLDVLLSNTFSFKLKTSPAVCFSLTELGPTNVWKSIANNVTNAPSLTVI